MMKHDNLLPEVLQTLEEMTKPFTITDENDNEVRFCPSPPLRRKLQQAHDRLKAFIDDVPDEIFKEFKIEDGVGGNFFVSQSSLPNRHVAIKCADLLHTATKGEIG